MTDPTPDDQSANEQSYFTWWIVMLFFLIPIIGMLCVWFKDKTATHWLVYAGLTLLVGIVVGSIAATGGSGSAEASPSDQTKSS